MAKRYELTDAQRRRIADLLPGKTSDPGRTGVDNRLFVNAVLWVSRSGAHWHDLPKRYLTIEPTRQTNLRVWRFIISECPPGQFDILCLTYPALDELEFSRFPTEGRNL